MTNQDYYRRLAGIARYEGFPEEVARMVEAAEEMHEALLIVQDRIDRGWFPWIRPDDVWPNAVNNAIVTAEVGK